MNVEINTREVTETKTFITLNVGTEYEDEFELPRVLDFLETIMETDGYMSGIKAPDHFEKKIAEALEKGVVDRTYSAGWYEVDEEKINSLWERLMCVYYEDLTEDEVNAEDMMR